MSVRRGFLLGLIVLAACAQPSVVRNGVSVPYEQAERADLARARGYIKERRFAEAGQVLETMIRELPRGRHIDEALFLLAQVRLELGQGDRAMRAWRRLLDEHPRSSRAPEASLRLAKQYRTRGRPEIARQVLERAAVARADPKLRARIFRLLADLSRVAGDYPAAVHALALARRDLSDPDSLYELDVELEELIRDRLDDSELAAVVARLPHGPARAGILFEMARRALARGDYNRANTVLDRLPRRLTPAQEAERRVLRGWARSVSQVGTGTIGLAVPLSGPYAAFGKSVLRGVTLALGVFENPPQNYQIVIRDTAGEVEQGEQAVQELAASGVRAIIGPMRSVVASGVAPLVESLRIPLLTLSPREGLADLGAFVFRFGMTPADQVRQLLDYAFERRGERRFAVLYPRAAYGRRFKNLFWNEVERRGGVVVGAEGYDPQAVDFQNPIKKLVGMYYITPEERKLIQERERLIRRRLENEERLAEIAQTPLPPYVDFDALFIPDVADQVGLILPQLHLYDIKGVQFLGTSDWNDPKLIEIAGREASGVVFTDAFDVTSEDPVARDFVTNFRAAYLEMPDLFAALGFDSATLLRRRIDASGTLSRVELRDELLATRDFPGVTGRVSFTDGGSVERHLRLFTVRHGKILGLVALH